MINTFTSPFTGTVVEPTDVSYYALTLVEDTQLYWPAVVNPEQVPAARIIDCTPAITPVQLILPQGNQGSVGSDILIRNLGSIPFDVVDFTLNSSVTIDPGISKYFYLSDNTTIDGVWQNVTFGAGTSSADAASLQGPGLTTLFGKLAVTSNIVEISSAPTMTDASRAASYVWVSGAGTINLPDVASLTDGWWIGFRNGGTGTLTIQATSPSTINGLTSIAVNPNNSGFIYFEKATGTFFTFGFAAEVNPTFTSATYDVDSIPGSTFSLVQFAPNIQNYEALSGTRTTNLTITLPAVTQLYGFINDTSSGAYDLIFEISGGVNTVTLPAGQVAVVVANGPILYVISQTTTDIFYGGNGSATVPTFSFTNDTETGMYLVGTSILGFTANGTEMMAIDNTNTSSPQISTPATFTAGLITGGSF